MKKFTMVLTAIVLTLVLVGSASAQTATQVLNLTVSPVQLLTVGGAVNLTVGAGATAGSDALTQATASSTYAYAFNSATASTKITAAITTGGNLPGAMVLGVTFVPSAGKGTATPQVLSTTAVNVLTAIANGFDDATMDYTLDAKVSDGAFSGSRTITYTITN